MSSLVARIVNLLVVTGYCSSVVPLALAQEATPNAALPAKSVSSSSSSAKAPVAAIGLATVQDAVRRAPEAQAATSAAQNAASAAADADRRSASGGYELETEYRKEEESQPQVGAWLGTTIRFGIDKDAITRQHEAEGRAAVAEADGSLLEASLGAAADFVELLRLQRVVAATAALSKEINPFVSRAEQAAKRGDADGLGAVKWRLFADALRAEHRSSVDAFKALAAHFRVAYGLDVAEDPAAAKLLPVAPLKSSGETVESPAAQAEAARALAAEARALAWEDARSFDVALGVERDLDSGFTSVSARLTVPLSQGSFARAEAASAMAERSAGAARAALTKRHDGRALASLQVRAQMAATHVRNLEDRREAVRSLLTRTVGALDRGLAEGAAAVEAADGLFAAEVDLANAKKDYELAVAEQVLRRGGTP